MRFKSDGQPKFGLKSQKKAWQAKKVDQAETRQNFVPNWIQIAKFRHTIFFVSPGTQCALHTHTHR